MPPDWHGFTTTARGGLLRVLKNKCGISEGYNPVTGAPPPDVKEFDAIWDTGATDSVITQAVVDACGLAPIGMAQVHGVGGVATAEVYLVNIYLPNNVAFPYVRVTKGADMPDAQVLIGMNVISMGDFAVTNAGGVTKFSFRLPSQEHIDYVKEHKILTDRERFAHGGSKKGRKKRPKKHGKNKK